MRNARPFIPGGYNIIIEKKFFPPLFDSVQKAFLMSSQRLPRSRIAEITIKIQAQEGKK